MASDWDPFGVADLLDDFESGTRLGLEGGGILPGMPSIRQDLIDAENLKGVRALMGENSDMKSRLGRANNRATKRRAGRVGKTAGAGGAASLTGKFSKMGLGGKLMMGAGTIGTALMIFQLLGMLGDGATANSDARGLARDDSRNAFANTRGSMDRGRDQDRLKISQGLRSTAMRNDNEYNSRPASRELRNIMTSDPMQLYKLRQQMAPSMREAMARSGLYA